MRLAYRSHYLALCSMAVLLCASAAIAYRNVNHFDALAPSEIRSAQPELGSLLTEPDRTSSLADPVVKVNLSEPQASAKALKAVDECLEADDCVDQYLWSMYERTRKIDTIAVRELIQVTVKKKGHKRSVSKAITKLVDEDFTWKDGKAAEKVDMPLPDYVIGGMDRDFKVRLYHLFHALEEAGLAPGMTSGFRDNYRQSIASGNKAATDSSYHGGSRRGGFGHGLAADVVSVKGETRSERWLSSESVWKWIDAHGEEFGVGRPYLDRDPPHVGPIDGQEYAKHRGSTVQRAGL